MRKTKPTCAAKRTRAERPLQAGDPDGQCLRNVEQLLLRAGRGLGLQICFHDRLHRVGIRQILRVHRSAFCRKIKRRHGAARCMAYDLQATHQALAGVPEGRIQTCPYGATEIVVPVFTGGVYAGVLFAGPCWTRQARAPDASLVIPPARSWLADRLILLRGVARELAALLAEPRAQDVCSERVRHYIQDHMAESIYLAALARHLSLSPSRARHKVKELFGVSFSALVRSVKLQEAARWLRTTDLTVSEVAVRVGMDDANYFSRAFRRFAGVAPREYRRAHPTSP